MKNESILQDLKVLKLYYIKVIRFKKCIHRTQNPVLSLLGGWIYGKVCGFDWLILWLIAFLFIPVIYFHMAGQWDCMIYPGIYIVVMSLGMVVGKIFQKKKVV